MRRIAVISFGYMWFPCESGTSRLYEIAQMFQKNGYKVEIITTGFQHFKKEKRDEELILSQGYPFKITFIDAPAYKKNIDLRRVYSNYVVAKKLKKYLTIHIKEYDVVYVTIPANNVSAEVTTICKKEEIPVIVDIEDLWPEAMSMVIKNVTFRNLLLYRFLRDAEITYANANGIVGTSHDYTDRAFVKRKRDIPAITVYVGCNLKDFDAGVLLYADTISKEDNEIWVTYAGSLGTSYDIDTLIKAAQDIYLKGYINIKFKILGSGPRLEEFRKLSLKSPCNVEFLGYVEYKKMAGYLFKSDILVNSVVKKSHAGIINKVGDYLAAGKPMINTQSNMEFRKKVENDNFGVNVIAEDVICLSQKIIELYETPECRKQMGTQARRIAETQFDRENSYHNIVKMCENILP